jgi:hypothetical protein
MQTNEANTTAKPSKLDKALKVTSLVLALLKILAALADLAARLGQS